MSEFGNQIDIEYEVWRESPTGKFEQVPIGASGHFYGISLERAEELIERVNRVGAEAKLGRYFPVEVVSVRTECGVADVGA